MTVMTGSLPLSSPSGSSLITPTTNLLAYTGGNFSDISVYDPYASVGGESTSTALVAIYRGIIGGVFVFSEGTPPGGATSVTIIGYR